MKRFERLTIGETGEWGSPDSTSAGPPVNGIVRNIAEYTATNLLILAKAIESELERRLSHECAGDPQTTNRRPTTARGTQRQSIRHFI
jgi:hypothetical protein